jgi:hypothetical protein
MVEARPQVKVGESSSREYCRACRDDDLACTRGELRADGRLCPSREHTLISLQEHDAWDVLLACQGQLRLAPTGHVVGINQSERSAQNWRRTRLQSCGPLGAVAAGRGGIEALCSDRVRDDAP